MSTWGALEEALSPQRQEILANLLAKKRGIDPAMTSITGPVEERPLVLREPEAAPDAPTAAPTAAAAAASPGAAPARRAPMTVYDTPYGEDLRKADREVRNAFWGYQQANTRQDRDRLTRLAEAYIARSEGRDENAERMTAAERATENSLTKSVLDASAADAAQRARERIAALSRKKFSKGTPIDRGEDGVFVPVMNEDTGELSVETLDVPKKRITPPAPAVHGLGAGGGVYFDAQGRPRVIPPVREPKERAAPKAVPDGVVSEIVKGYLSQPIDPLDPNGPKLGSDPAAVRKVVLMLRENGILPAPGEPPSQAPSGAQGPSPDEAAALTHGPAQRPPVLSGRGGGPAQGGRPMVARNPKTGERLVLQGGKWVPAR